MEVELRAGVKVDFLNRAELEQVMDAHAAEVIKALGRPQAIPLLNELEAQASSGASSTTAVIDLGGPPAGYYWLVRSWSISGQDANVVTTGSCFVYITGGVDPGFPVFPPTALRDLTANIPDIGDWSQNQRIVRPPSRLVFRFTGLPNSTAVFAMATVEERALQENPANGQIGYVPPKRK